MVPQRFNAYAGGGQAAPGAGTSTVLEEADAGLELVEYDELALAVVLSDDAAATAKSAEVQFYTNDTLDPDLGNWTAVEDPVALDFGEDAVVNAALEARKHTRQFSGIYGCAVATITHSDAGANTVTACAVLVGISGRVE